MVSPPSVIATNFERSVSRADAPIRARTPGRASRSSYCAAVAVFTHSRNPPALSGSQSWRDRLSALFASVPPQETLRQGSSPAQVNALRSSREMTPVGIYPDMHAGYADPPSIERRSYSVLTPSSAETLSRVWLGSVGSSAQPANVRISSRLLEVTGAWPGATCRSALQIIILRL